MSNGASPSVETFSQWLREHREARGLVLRDVEAKTGLDLSLLCRLESGDREPTEEQAEALAKFFGEAPAHVHALRIKGHILRKHADHPAMPDAIQMIAEEAGLYVTALPPVAKKGAR